MADEKDEITPIIEDDKMLDEVGKGKNPEERTKDFLDRLKGDKK